MNDPAAARAWSWVAHLRAGGCTPWGGWTGRYATAGAGEGPSGPSGSSAVSVSGRLGLQVLPGAQQLELLRRVNAAGLLPAATRDRVLTASGLDRGLADLPLPGGPRAAFGPVPVDPADVPVEELLRFAVLLLADALPGVVPDEQPPGEQPGERPGVGGRAVGRGRSRRARLRRLTRGGYCVVGDPWLAARVREDLRRRGRPPGGRLPRVAVVAGPVPAMLAHTWTHRVWHDGAPAWADWVAARAGGPLPWGADVVGQADKWAARVGARRVVVVTDLAEVGRLAGVRRPDLVPDGGLEPGGDATELARRVRDALCVVAPPHRHRALLLDGLLPATEGMRRGSLPSVPPEHARWAARRAGNQYHRLREAGYAVAGDVDLLLLGADVVADGPDQDTTRPEHVLDLAVALLARGLVPGTGAEDGPAHSSDRAVDQGGQGA